MRTSLSESAVAVSATGVHKHFGRVRALDGLDLHVAAGEVHGFLGPNGAGKSTTIRAMLAQLRIDGGRLRVLGGDPWRDTVAIHERLAYVPGDTALWPGLTGGECIDMLGRFRGSHNAGRRVELVDRFELDPTRRARTYSKGNRQKVALVAALATDVDLYLLDEPTSGLDPLMAARFQETVLELRAAGRTVLLSSHILDEVERLCDRVTIIRSGRTVATGTLDQLRAGARTTITVTTPAPVSPTAFPGEQHRVTETLADGAVRTRLTTAGPDVPAAVTAVAALGPRTLTVEPPSLDDLFREHYVEEAS